MNTSKLLKWGLPFFILLLVGPFSSTLDLFLSNHYYSDESFSSHPYFTFFYHYGCYPAFILGGIATIIFFTSLPSQRRRRRRPAGSAVEGGPDLDRWRALARRLRRRRPPRRAERSGLDALSRVPRLRGIPPRRRGLVTPGGF